jgi:hypothetical protein
MSLNFTIDILKQFDGQYNYFNPSHCNGITIFRRETKYDNKLLVSDIVDDKNNIILEHHIDDYHLYSYEDARFIDQNEISVCVCKRNKEDLTQIIEVSYKKYNLLTKNFTHYKTQKSHFEKNWQFYEDKIIYHVNPYTVMDSNENVLFTYDINWTPWIEKYGNPGLSTNVFELDGKKYLLFHSYITRNGISLKYYVGVLKLNNNLIPIGYYNMPLFESVEDNNIVIFQNYFNWKRKLDPTPTITDIIFPMNINVNDIEKNINIYAGINDCIAAKITILYDEYFNFIKKLPMIPYES